MPSAPVRWAASMIFWVPDTTGWRATGPGYTASSAMFYVLGAAVGFGIHGYGGDAHFAAGVRMMRQAISPRLAINIFFMETRIIKARRNTQRASKVIFYWRNKLSWRQALLSPRRRVRQTQWPSIPSNRIWSMMSFASLALNTLQTNDDGHGNLADVVVGVHDTADHTVATYDTAKDVDEKWLLHWYPSK